MEDASDQLLRWFRHDQPKNEDRDRAYHAAKAADAKRRKAEYERGRIAAKCGNKMGQK